MKAAFILLIPRSILWYVMRAMHYVNTSMSEVALPITVIGTREATSELHTSNPSAANDPATSRRSCVNIVMDLRRQL